MAIYGKYSYYKSEKIEMTNTTDNHNKFYHMTKNPGGLTFTIKYGRIGSVGVKKIYNINKWQEILDDKLNKGYDIINTWDRYQDSNKLSEGLKLKIDKLSNLSLIYKVKQSNHKKIFNEIEIISADILDKELASKTQLSRITELVELLTVKYKYNFKF